jgi:hypothetical protein
MEKIFSHAWKGKRGVSEVPAEEDKKKHQSLIEDYVDDEQGLQRKHVVDTTLIVHFFGKKGKDELRFEGFRRSESASKIIVRVRLYGGGLIVYLLIPNYFYCCAG